MSKIRLNRSFIPWLIAHFFEFWYYYLGAFLSLFFLHTFQSRIPLLAKELGDLVAEGKINEVSSSTFIYLAISIIVFRTSSRLLFFYPARIQQKILRVELLQKIESAHPSRYEDQNDGQLYQVLFNDFNRLRGLVGFGLLQVGNIVIAFSIFIPKINEFNPNLLKAFSPMIFGVLVFSTIMVLFQKFIKKEMDVEAEVNNFLIESYEGKQTIKNFHAESSFLNLFKKVSAKELHLFFMGSLGPALSFPIINLCFGATLIYGAYIVKTQDLGATALIFFTGFLFLVMEPIAFLSWIGVVFSHAIAAWKRIKFLLNKLDTESALELEMKCATSSADATILDTKFWNSDIHLEFKHKKWSVLSGETGSGKSYLLNRFADLLECQGEKYSLVAQAPYLFNDTLINNIFLGREFSKEEEEEAWELIQIFGLDYLANSRDAVIHLEIGENGKKVSGGQAKRICLIRSLLSDTDYLLWDDPFSSIDLILEKQIIKKLILNKLFENKTIVLTSHRLSTVRYCDEIYLIGTDGIIESGKVKELLTTKSKVSEYFEKQLA